MERAKNGLRTEDTEDTPFGGAYINKDGITLRGAIFVSIGKQSPFTAPAVVTKSATNSVDSFHRLTIIVFHSLNNFCVFRVFCVRK